MSFSLGSLFHAAALKVIAIEVLKAAKPEIDAALASVPVAAVFEPEADALLDAVVARLQHLADKQDLKPVA